MKWLKRLGILYLFFCLIQLILIADVFLKEEENIKIEQMRNGRFKANLIFRNFYFEKNKVKNIQEHGVFKVDRFPEKSFADGLNHGRNISPVFNWEIWEREERKLEENEIIVLYHVKLFLIFNLNKLIIFNIETDQKGEPILLKYKILPETL